MMDAVNSDAPEGEEIVQSRYSIVMASAKRARQIALLPFVTDLMK